MKRCLLSCTVALPERATRIIAQPLPVIALAAPGTVVCAPCPRVFAHRRAIRESLQRRIRGVTQRWGAPNDRAGHHVARAITIGTPHLGSDASPCVRLSQFTPDISSEDGAFSAIAPSTRAVRRSAATARGRWR